MTLNQKYRQDAVGSNSLRAAFHRWNVWRTYQGMKGETDLTGDQSMQAIVLRR